MEANVYPSLKLTFFSHWKFQWLESMKLFPFAMPGLFSGVLAVSFREGKHFFFFTSGVCADWKKQDVSRIVRATGWFTSFFSENRLLMRELWWFRGVPLVDEALTWRFYSRPTPKTHTLYQKLRPFPNGLRKTRFSSNEVDNQQKLLTLFPVLQLIPTFFLHKNFGRIPQKKSPIGDDFPKKPPESYEKHPTPNQEHVVTSPLRQLWKENTSTLLAPGWFFRNLCFRGCNVFPPACAKNLIPTSGRVWQVPNSYVCRPCSDPDCLVCDVSGPGKCDVSGPEGLAGGGSLDVGPWSPRVRSWQGFDGYIFLTQNLPNYWDLENYSMYVYQHPPMGGV